jgi:hypothetical protein
VQSSSAGATRREHAERAIQALRGSDKYIEEKLRPHLSLQGWERLNPARLTYGIG